MSKRRVTLAGTKRKGEAPQRIYRGEARKDMVRRVTDVLRNWRLSPFEHEGNTRAGFRAALVLDGHGWQAADDEAAALIAESFHLLGAVRPTWFEGQMQYSAGTDYCWSCRGPLEEEDRAAGRRFCCDDCARLARTHRTDIARYADQLAYNSAYYVAFKDGLPEADCEWCGARYKMQHLKQRFCSKSCAQNVVWGERKVKPKPCLQCGTIFRGLQVEAKFCSPKCSARHRVDNMSERHCEVCKAVFRPRSSNAAVCSPVCLNARKVAYNRRKREEARQAAASAFICEKIVAFKEAAE
jgi:hypothetical protein